jgi:hypothetical protein
MNYATGNRKVVERSTGDVYSVDFVVDSQTKFGFNLVVTQQFRDLDIVCEQGRKIFRPNEIEFLEDITQESWARILKSRRV